MADAHTTRLLLFGVSRLSDMLEKGNVWYVRHYESYFDAVDVVYLHGFWPTPVAQGKTRLIALGRGRFPSDILAAPWRLLRHAQRTSPTHYLSADIVFSWWTGLLLHIFAGARVVLMPVCIPDEIYKSTGRSMSGLPIWLERICLRLSYASASSIIMGRHSDASLAWLRGDWQTKRKLHIVPATMEEFPSREFYDALAAHTSTRNGPANPARLLYVGRLHREKLVDGLIDMMAELRQLGISARLVIAGDGPELRHLQDRANRLYVADDIEWLGFLQPDELAATYGSADVFISTVTGTALREAGLFGLPIVGYNADWVKHFLVHEQNALLVETGDHAALAEQVSRVLSDRGLRQRLAATLKQLCDERWAPTDTRNTLKHTFEAA